MLMIYLSKGILPWKPSGASISVSHCGMLHKLTDIQAELWLAGQHQPGYTQNAKQETALRQLAELGIVVHHDAEAPAALFRLLTNCAICPVRVKTTPSILNRSERRILMWIKQAGLMLTIAELTSLAERGIKPTAVLLGEQNRQSLTELIYTTDTIFNSILETLMESSPAQKNTVKAVLGLLHKKRIYLI